jgi:molybdate transport repressor ModE-like protein
MKQKQNVIVAGSRHYLCTIDGEGVFGPGRGELLAGVEKLGSLRKAASTLGRSYRKAWNDINSAEKHLGFALVARSHGGIGGGTMVLTDRGRQFLRAWERHSEHVVKAVESSYRKYIFKVLSTFPGVTND